MTGFKRTTSYDQNTSEVSNSSLNGLIEQGPRVYNFKHIRVDSEFPALKTKKLKEQYKYNLFSILDEAGNNGCRNGCFAGNEIIASRLRGKSFKIQGKYV
ncbi:unnamed protein product [Sphagnum balticum]